MKLKKSHILLISLISIFLLSLSAVSASDMDDQLLSADSAIDAIDDVDEISDVDDNLNDNKLSQVDETSISDDSGDEGEGGDTDPIATTVESNDTSYNYGENIKLNVSVKDNESNPITITKENLKVYSKNATEENFTERNFTLNNESQIVLDKKLAAGIHTINIKFLGNDTFAASETNISLNIVVADTTVNASDAKANIGGDIIIPFKIYVGPKTTLNVNASRINITCDGVEYNFTNTTGGNNITDGIKLLNFTKEPGNYSILIQYKGNENCNPSSATITLSLLANNTIKANDTIKVNINGYNATIPIVITNSNGTNITNLTVTKEDLKLYLKYYNGTDNVTDEIDFELSGQPGNYTINFVNDKVDNSQLTIVFGEGTLNETNKTINLTTYRNAKIEVVNAVAEYQNGNFTFKLVDADTNAPIANTNVTVSGVYFYSNVNGTSARPSLQFTSDENGLIFIKNVNMNKDLDFSFFVYNFTALKAGNYNLTFKGNSSLDLNQNVEITVNPVKVKIVADNYKEYVGSTKKFTFKLVNAVTGEVLKLVSMQFKVKTGNTTTTYNATTNLTGQASFNVKLMAGTYPVTLLTNSADVVKATLNRTITIIKKPGVLTASNRTIKYGTDPTAIIKFTDKKTGKAIVDGIVKVRLYTTSKKYVDLAFRTNKTGYVKFSAALSVGKHKMIISSLDNNYTASSITRYVTVKKTTGKFSASKVTTYYRSGKLYKVKLINTKNNKAMYGAKMIIKVFTSKTRYYRYDGTTAGNGIVQFKINYKPGTYKVVISANDKGYTAKSVTKQIKVTKSPIKMTPTSLKVKKGKAFKVKVTSTKSKKVISGVKVKVKVFTGKKYSTYTIKTNKKGIASLTIKQKVGKHKIVLSPGSPKLYSAKALTKTLVVTK